MFAILVRTFILYILVVTSVRLMGKRQIGELQPTELVITILLSEVASIPMEDPEIPLINSVVSIFLLVSFEIITSVLSMKSTRLRSVIQGNSVIIIRNGKFDQTQMKKLRFTVDDVLESLRQKDVFDISEVQYAIVETNGTLSVLLKNDYKPATVKDMKLTVNKSGLPCLIVSDGRILKKNFSDCGMSRKKLKKILKENKTTAEDILLLTSDIYGNINLIKKEKNL